MRVLHVITRLILGGAQENTLFTLEDLIHDFGDDVLLITGPQAGSEGSLLERARKNQVPLRTVDSLRRELNPGNDIRAYIAIKRILRHFQPDVVHTHSSKAGILGRAAAHDCCVPAIIHTVHGLPFHPFERKWRNAIYIAAERWAAKRCHRIICVADAMSQQALEAKIGHPDQYVTIRSGMDVQPFLDPPRARNDVRQEMGFGSEHIVVAKVARLFELKGHDDVIEAAQDVVRVEPNVRFLFIGGGPRRQRLEDQIHHLGMSQYFQFLGLVPPERISELLNASDLVVHASYREGLARVLPQALIAGRSVVSYDVDGAREVVLPGKTGILVQPGDIPGLAQAILELALDRDRRNRFGQFGRERFTDVFRHDEMTRQIRHVYEDVLGGGSLDRGSRAAGPTP